MIKKTTIEDLAVMVSRGFTEIEKKMATKDDLAQFATKDDLAQLRTELRTEMHVGFQHVNARLDVIHQDISDLPDIREEVKSHDERITRVEQKVRLMK